MGKLFLKLTNVGELIEVKDILFYRECTLSLESDRTATNYEVIKTVWRTICKRGLLRQIFVGY
jgi:hypothetical protein